MAGVAAWVRQEGHPQGHTVADSLVDTGWFVVHVVGEQLKFYTLRRHSLLFHAHPQLLNQAFAQQSSFPYLDGQVQVQTVQTMAAVQQHLGAHAA